MVTRERAGRVAQGGDDGGARRHLRRHQPKRLEVVEHPGDRGGGGPRAGALRSDHRAGMKVSLWSYRIEPSDGGCLVTERWLDERGVLVKALGKLVSGVSDRVAHNRAGMEQTLANLKQAAEA